MLSTDDWAFLSMACMVADRSRFMAGGEGFCWLFISDGVKTRRVSVLPLPFAFELCDACLASWAVAGSPLKRGLLEAVLDAVEPWDEDGRREKNEVIGGVDFGAAFLLLVVVFLAIATTTFSCW
jgi:hypothetical protein